MDLPQEVATLLVGRMVRQPGEAEPQGHESAVAGLQPGQPGWAHTGWLGEAC